MTHSELLKCWPSARRMAIESGIPLRTCIRWHSQQEIPRPEYWLVLLREAVRRERLYLPGGYDVALAGLAKDSHRMGAS
mgnify:CR=1 FL=1